MYIKHVKRLRKRHDDDESVCLRTALLDYVQVLLAFIRAKMI